MSRRSWIVRPKSTGKHARAPARRIKRGPSMEDPTAHFESPRRGLKSRAGGWQRTWTVDYRSNGSRARLNSERKSKMTNLRPIRNGRLRCAEHCSGPNGPIDISRRSKIQWLRVDVPFSHEQGSLTAGAHCQRRERGAEGLTHVYCAVTPPVGDGEAERGLSAQCRGPHGSDRDAEAFYLNAGPLAATA